MEFVFVKKKRGRKLCALVGSRGLDFHCRVMLRGVCAVSAETVYCCHSGCCAKEKPVSVLEISYIFAKNTKEDKLTTQKPQKRPQQSPHHTHSPADTQYPSTIPQAQ